MKKIAIIGLGLMGGSLGLALKKHVSDVLIYGMDKNEDYLEYCLEHDIVDKPLTNNHLPEIDMVFIAVPVRAIIDVIDNIYPYLNKEKTIISDLGSTKLYLYNEIENKYFDLKYIGGHPMAGKEKSGPVAADADLFLGRKYILNKTKDKANIKKCDLDNLKNIIHEIGADLLFLTPEKHDQMVAFTSHLPQFLATGIINQLIKNELEDNNISNLIGTGFLDFSRIAASDTRMWLDIFITNKQHVTDSIKKVLATYEEFLRAIESEDKEAITNILEQGRQRRNQL